METVKNYLILAMGMLLAVLAIATGYYQKQASQAKLTLSIQNGLVENQNRQAADLLATRTKERDALQTQLNAAAKAQEKTDETGKSQIAADTQRDASAPVRVRCITHASGARGGGAAGQTPAPAAARDGDAGSAGGVLAPAPAELFKRDQDAVEKLQLAFNSCRAQLIKE